jgi:hypothetical protein
VVIPVLFRNHEGGQSLAVLLPQRAPQGTRDQLKYCPWNILVNFSLSEFRLSLPINPIVNLYVVKTRGNDTRKFIPIHPRTMVLVRRMLMTRTQGGFSASKPVSTGEQGRLPTGRTNNNPQYLSHFDPRRSMNQPSDCAIYNRPVGPRMSHASVDTHHTRDPSYTSEARIPVGPRHSHGPLSLTADRYRGACNPSPATSSAPTRHRRRPEGLSIDTTLSKGSY